MNAILFHNLTTGAMMLKEAVACPICKAAHFLMVNRWGRTVCAGCAKEAKP